jgi:hypothetical protein
MKTIIKKIIYFNSNIFKNISYNKFKKDFIIKDNLIGGGHNNIKINYKDIEYKFIKIESEHQYILFSDDKNKHECISIIISKEDKIAEIHGISNYISCLKKSNLLELTNTGVGSILLKITLKMLKKYKDKLGINKISLTDNSKKKCSNKNIVLSQMLFLLTSNTWYGKYGFRPREIFENKLDEQLDKKYQENQSIINRITIKESNILNYILKTNNEKLIKATTRLLKENENMLLKTYLSNLIKDYDKTCTIFYLFYKDLYFDIGLTDFSSKPFILFI